MCASEQQEGEQWDATFLHTIDINKPAEQEQAAKMKRNGTSRRLCIQYAACVADVNASYTAERRQCCMLNVLNDDCFARSLAPLLTESEPRAAHYTLANVLFTELRHNRIKDTECRI